MRRIAVVVSIAACTLGLALAGRGEDRPFLHPLFTDHMVLQRDLKAPVWGWTEPGKRVTVSMNGKTAEAVAGADGRWVAKLGPFPAGGPFTLTVTGPQSATVTNVLVGDFGFHIVQLANFLPTCPDPRDNDWAEIRESQMLTTRAVPNCGIASAIDIGDANDIHPRNKQEVGRRLALSALAVTYGRHEVECSGPWFKKADVTDKGIRLSFDHLGGGLVAKGEKLTGFAIAGEDRKFVWGDATVDGDTVLVSLPAVAKPAAVRYAWDVNPVCNLYNKAGLPAVPFRTDDWPAITLNNK